MAARTSAAPTTDVPEEWGDYSRMGGAEAEAAVPACVTAMADPSTPDTMASRRDDGRPRSRLIQGCCRIEVALLQHTRGARSRPSSPRRWASPTTPSIAPSTSSNRRSRSGIRRPCRTRAILARPRGDGGAGRGSVGGGGRDSASVTALGRGRDTPRGRRRATDRPTSVASPSCPAPVRNDPAAAQGGLLERRFGANSRSSGLTGDVSAEHAVHPRLPPFAGSPEVVQNLGAVAHRYE